MNTEVQEMLERAPSPLRYTLAFFMLIAAGIFIHAAFLGAAGLVIGFYFGEYHGRLKVIAAWRRELEIESEKRMAALDTEIL